MDLSHQFTVPTGVDETWAHFQDIAGLAACFPGATVTDADGDTFAGSVKVKLGPIALVYNGSGTFVEKDDDAHRFVVDAKGKDKRGNGTAGAVVTLSMTESATGGTDVDVRTDLNVTGKPAQFGRGAMQDVSDKLLGRFVACLEERLTASPEPEPGPAGESDHQQATAMSPPPSSSPVTTSTSAPTAAPTAAASASSVSASRSTSASSAASSSAAAPRPQHRNDDDVLDLGATVLPVLLRTYRTQIAAGLGLLLLVLLLRRRRG